MDDFLSPLLYSISALFVIRNPLLSVPIFSEMTQGQSSYEVTKQGWIAVGLPVFRCTSYSFSISLYLMPFRSLSQAFRWQVESFYSSSVSRKLWISRSLRGKSTIACPPFPSVRTSGAGYGNFPLSCCNLADLEIFYHDSAVVWDVVIGILPECWTYFYRRLQSG